MRKHFEMMQQVIKVHSIIILRAFRDDSHEAVMKGVKLRARTMKNRFQILEPANKLKSPKGKTRAATKSNNFTFISDSR